MKADEAPRRNQRAGLPQPSVLLLKGLPPELRIGRALRWVWAGQLTPEEAVEMLAESTRASPPGAEGR